MEKRDARTIEERAEMYRRQLGGAEKALRRERQRTAELESLVLEAIRAMRGCPEHAYWPCMHDIEAKAHELGLEVVR